VSEKTPEEIQTFRRGLYYLLDQLATFQRPVVAGKKVELPVELPNHPFRLQSPMEFKAVLKYVGTPGITDESTSSFAFWIGSELSCFGYSIHPRYLRVILAERQEDDRSKHDVYFEIGLNGLTGYICGGCTDIKGSRGGHGKETLDAVFALLSKLSGTTVQTVTIPYEEAEPLRKKFEDYVAAYRRGEI
jgi:hypothetical protein